MRMKYVPTILCVITSGTVWRPACPSEPGPVTGGPVTRAAAQMMTQRGLFVCATADGSAERSD